MGRKYDTFKLCDFCGKKKLLRFTSLYGTSNHNNFICRECENIAIAMMKRS